MTALLAALWLLVGSSVTVMPLDTLPDGWTDAQHNLVLRDGRVLASALGCHAADDIRYYQRTRAIHLADVKREQPWIGFRSQLRIAHQRFVKTEAHELVHAVDCADDGLLNGSPGHHGYVSDDPYCRSNDAERFACAVVETGRIK